MSLEQLWKQIWLGGNQLNYISDLFRHNIKIYQTIFLKQLNMPVKML